MADEPKLPDAPEVPEMPEIPDIPEAAEISEFVSTYVIPWSINIFFAIAIFIVGRWVVKIISNLVKKALIKAKMDVILVNFVTSIVNTVLLLFVIIAALNQLGVQTRERRFGPAGRVAMRGRKHNLGDAQRFSPLAGDAQRSIGVSLARFLKIQRL